MHVYPNYYKKFCNYIKKILDTTNIKKNLFVKYKNDKLIVQQIKANSPI